MKTLLMTALMIVSFAAVAADPLSRTPPPSGASVYFIEPLDGATVPTTFTVKFGLKGMTIAPAGHDHPNSGHHHLLIDVAELPDLTKPLPATDHILHFGKEQTETQVTLTPGKHTLQLVFANYLHIANDPAVTSTRITVTVK